MKRLIKRKYILLSLLTAVIAVIMMAVPVSADPGTSVSISPPTQTVNPGDTFDITIMIDTDVATIGAICYMTYDDTLLDYVSAEQGTFYSDYGSTFYNNFMNHGAGTVGDLFVALTGGTRPAGSGSLFVIHMKAKDAVSGTSPITLQGIQISDESSQPVAGIVINDGSVTVGAPPPAPVLVSGTMEPDASVDAPPPYPPGFVPCDEFVPCQDIYVWGYGFEYCNFYEIYVQPYDEGYSVAEGQPLDHGLSPVGYTPKIIHCDDPDNGTIGPILLFHAEEYHICQYWEIVADKLDVPMTGIYNPEEDGLDAVALDEWGFHVVPEALTILLFGGGLAGLGGYVAVRRRKGR